MQFPYAPGVPWCWFVVGAPWTALATMGYHESSKGQGYGRFFQRQGCKRHFWFWHPIIFLCLFDGEWGIRILHITTCAAFNPSTCSESCVRYHFSCFPLHGGLTLQRDNIATRESCMLHALRGFPLAMVDEGCVHGLRGLDGLATNTAWPCCFPRGFPNNSRKTWFLTRQKGYSTEVAFHPFAVSVYCKLFYLPQLCHWIQWIQRCFEKALCKSKLRQLYTAGAVFFSSQIPTRGMSRRILISRRLAPFCRSIGVDVVFFSRQWNMAHLARLLQSHVTWNESKGGELTDWHGWAILVACRRERPAVWLLRIFVMPGVACLHIWDFWAFAQNGTWIQKSFTFGIYMISCRCFYVSQLSCHLHVDPCILPKGSADGRQARRYLQLGLCADLRVSHVRNTKLNWKLWWDVA